MSGHSKWHKIQHKKGKNDAKRGANFTKLLRAVTIAAGEGGGDPAMNFSLRLALEKAKAGNVPKDNIERAIKRGTGELKDGVQLSEALYEGFGPNGVAFLVEVVTDNTNRSVSDIKHLFSKNGGSMGGPGSVQWQFSKFGIVRFKISDWAAKKDTLELSLIEAGADDIIEDEEEVEVRSSVDSFKSVLDALQKTGIDPEYSGLEWIAKETVELEEAPLKKVETLYEALDEHDDVKAVYTNL